MNDALKTLTKKNFTAKEILLEIALKQGETPKDLNKVDEDNPKLDIHLREGLRIMADWIELRGVATTSSVTKEEKGEKEI